MRALLPLTLAIFMLGCGATQQTAQVQQQTIKEESRACELEVAYHCPQPVVGQPYSCEPTVTDHCATR
jgi:hypothetical protein